MSIQTDAAVQSLSQRLLALEIRLAEMEKRLERAESERATLRLKKDK